MKNFFKVINQTEPVSVQKQDGLSINKSTIVLQEIGGRSTVSSDIKQGKEVACQSKKYENQYVCTLLGNLALCKFYPDDYVYAALRFSSREYNGSHYMDCTVQDIVSFSNHQ